jgi:chemotaxis family two-component system response regulator PixG
MVKHNLSLIKGNLSFMYHTQERTNALLKEFSLTEEIDKLIKENATGELILFRNNKLLGKLAFLSGRLVYAIDTIHRVRRWQRSIKQNCAYWNGKYENISHNNLWETEILSLGINQNNISLLEAREILRQVTQECLFQFLSQKEVNKSWQNLPSSYFNLRKALTLSALEIQSIKRQAISLQKQWQESGLNNFSPNLAPKLKLDIPSQFLPIKPQYLNGQLTIWDLALQEKKSIIEVTNALMPFLYKKQLELLPIPDLSLQTISFDTDSTPITLTRKQGLIASIDDSPVVAHWLKRILIPAGYKLLTINEPLTGIGEIVKHKPDLIFLDLKMPTANGYNICQFLRTTPAFKDTPIIILTNQDSIADRNRAIRVGATDFLSKNATIEQVLGVVEKNLQDLIGVDLLSRK